MGIWLPDVTWLVKVRTLNCRWNGEQFVCYLHVNYSKTLLSSDWFPCQEHTLFLVTVLWHPSYVLRMAMGQTLGWCKSESVSWSHWYSRYLYSRPCFIILRSNIKIQCSFFICLYYFCPIKGKLWWPVLNGWTLWLLCCEGYMILFISPFRLINLLPRNRW